MEALVYICLLQQARPGVIRLGVATVTALTVRVFCDRGRRGSSLVTRLIRHQNDHGEPRFISRGHSPPDCQGRSPASAVTPPSSLSPHDSRHGYLGGRRL